MRLFLLLTALVLSGCVHANPMYDQNGDPIWAITCDGTAQSMNDCFRMANKVCGAEGYRLLSAEEALGPTIATGSLAVNNTGGFGNYSQIQGVSRTAYVACQSEIAE